MIVWSWLPHLHDSIISQYYSNSGISPKDGFRRSLEESLKEDKNYEYTYLSEECEVIQKNSNKYKLHKLNYKVKLNYVKKLNGSTQDFIVKISFYENGLLKLDDNDIKSGTNNIINGTEQEMFPIYKKTFDAIIEKKSFCIEEDFRCAIKEFIPTVIAEKIDQACDIIYQRLYRLLNLRLKNQWDESLLALKKYSDYNEDTKPEEETRYKEQWATLEVAHYPVIYATIKNFILLNENWMSINKDNELTRMETTFQSVTSLNNIILSSNNSRLTTISNTLNKRNNALSMDNNGQNDFMILLSIVSLIIAFFAGSVFANAIGTETDPSRSWALWTFLVLVLSVFSVYIIIKSIRCHM